jgi:uncharacterized caspase-like protein
MPDGEARELAALNIAGQVNTAAAWEAFLAEFGDGAYGNLARAALEQAQLALLEAPEPEAGALPQEIAALPPLAPPPPPVATEGGARLAVVIGNGNYPELGLQMNVELDAQAIAAAFRRLGFEVTMLLDANRSTMVDALNALYSPSRSPEALIVYFVGTGFSTTEGEYYLLPARIPNQVEERMRADAVSLTFVFAAIETASVLRLVIIDAARSNPYGPTPPENALLVARGLAPGTHVLFSDQANGQALNPYQGQLSAFAEALLDHIETPDLELGLFFDRVRSDVVRATRGQQQPVVYGGVSEPYYLAPGVGVVAE